MPPTTSPALLDALGDFGIHVGILVGQATRCTAPPTACSVLRILVHQLQRGAKRPLDHVDRLGPRHSHAASMWELPVRCHFRSASAATAPRAWHAPLEARVKCSLIVRIQRLQVHGRNGAVERRHLRGISGARLGVKIVADRNSCTGPRDWPLSGNSMRSVAPRMVFWSTYAAALRQPSLVPACLVEQHHRLQIVAHRHAPAIEVENLRHGRWRWRGTQTRSRPGEIVAAQRLAAHQTSGETTTASLGALPGWRSASAALIHIRRLPMRQSPECIFQP